MGRLSRVLVAGSVGLLPLLGCGSSDDTTTTGGHAGAGTGSSLACDATPQLDLTGTWAAFFQFSISLQSQPGGAIQMCPTDQVTSSTMLLIVDVQQDGTTTTTQPVACTLSLPVVSGLAGSCDDPNAANLVAVSVEMTKPLEDSMPLTPMSATHGTLSALTPGATLAMADRYTFKTGTTKPSDSMPKWVDTNPGCSASDINPGHTSQCDTSCVDDCASLTDNDNDSNPAVTFNACGTTADDRANGVLCNHDDPTVAGTTVQGRVFLDFSTDPKITGTVKSSCEVAGTFDATTIYNVVGGDVYLAGSKISVASTLKSLPAYVIDPNKSQFRMIRIDGKYGAPDWNVDMKAQPQAACQIAIQNQNQLK